jgi:hypothetical protein
VNLSPLSSFSAAREALSALSREGARDEIDAYTFLSLDDLVQALKKPGGRSQQPTDVAIGAQKKGADAARTFCLLIGHFPGSERAPMGSVIEPCAQPSSSSVLVPIDE